MVFDDPPSITYVHIGGVDIAVPLPPLAQMRYTTKIQAPDYTHERAERHRQPDRKPKLTTGASNASVSTKCAVPDPFVSSSPPAKIPLAASNRGENPSATAALTKFFKRPHRLRIAIPPVPHFLEERLLSFQDERTMSPIMSEVKFFDTVGDSIEPECLSSPTLEHIRRLRAGGLRKGSLLHEPAETFDEQVSQPLQPELDLVRDSAISRLPSELSGDNSELVAKIAASDGEYEMATKRGTSNAQATVYIHNAEESSLSQKDADELESALREILLYKDLPSTTPQRLPRNGEDVRVNNCPNGVADSATAPSSMGLVTFFEQQNSEEDFESQEDWESDFEYVELPRDEATNGRAERSWEWFHSRS